MEPKLLLPPFFSQLRLRGQPSVSDVGRTVLGFMVGLAILSAAVSVFTTNAFDYDNMRRGVAVILSGGNPWSPAARVEHYYNPPFAVLFLWPMLFATPKLFLAVGGASLVAFAFYQRAWVALAWFGTNTVLWLLAAGGIDMVVVGAGLLLLIAGDRSRSPRLALWWRVLGYGLLMVKPQGTVYMVALYILLRRDWKGLLVSGGVYGLVFLPLYPAWVTVVLNNPPLAQNEATHTLWAQFGPVIAGAIALSVILARRWRYWELGGALAGILMPYGMPGLPIFLTLSGVKSLRAIPIIVIWSACLAALTWVAPPPGVDFYSFISPRMAIYHLSMLGLALVLACLSPRDERSDTIAAMDWLRSVWFSFVRAR